MLYPHMEAVIYSVGQSNQISNQVQSLIQILEEQAKASLSTTASCQLGFAVIEPRKSCS